MRRKRKEGRSLTVLIDKRDNLFIDARAHANPRGHKWRRLVHRFPREAQWGRHRCRHAPSRSGVAYLKSIIREIYRV